jgi:hypothetical protein
MKTIYNYNRKTNEFTHSSNILKDDFGKYNLPAFSTDLAPVIPEKHKAFFVNNKWGYVEQFEYSYKLDEEGFVSINGSIEVETNEKCPDENCYKYVDGSWVLDSAKELCYLTLDYKNLIQAKWQEVIINGYNHNNYTFDFDDETLSIIGARLAHCNSTTNIGNAELTFYTSEKESVVFEDKASIVQFFEDFIKARNAVDQRRITLKAEVNACSTKEELKAVDITTGW